MASEAVYKTTWLQVDNVIRSMSIKNRVEHLHKKKDQQTEKFKLILQSQVPKCSLNERLRPYW